MQVQKSRVLVVLTLAIILISGFQTSLTKAQVPGEKYIDVPYHYQPNYYYCGPACLQMVFEYYGSTIAQNEIADAARTDNTYPQPYGSYIYEMVRAAHFSNLSTSQGNELSTHVTGYTNRSTGFAAFALTGTTIAQLKSLIDEGFPAIVLQWNTRAHEWRHFRVVVGYTSDKIIVHDPLVDLGGRDTEYFYEDFENLWESNGNWALVTYPWSIDLSYPATLFQGEIFTVTATVTYQRPAIFSPDYNASSSKATIHLPEGLSLGEYEAPTKTLISADYFGGTLPSGSAATTQWYVRADSLGSFEMSVEAEGLITGSVRGHIEGVFTEPYDYTDRIGGQAHGLAVVGQPPVTLTINPQSISVPATVPACYTVTVANNLDVEQTVILQSDTLSLLWMVPAGRWPHCNWTDGPYPFSTQFTLTPRETKDVKLYIHVDVHWPPFPRLTFNEPVFAHSSLDNFATIVTSAYAEFIVTGTPVSTSTGTGTASFSSNTGNLTDLQAVGEDSLPPEAQQTKPPEVTLPNGLFSFTIENLTPGQTVTVYIQMPQPVPIGSQYWKYQPGIGWFSLPIGSDDGDSEITITLTDGGIGDLDQTANGVIVDPGGPAPPVVPAIVDIAPDTLNPRSKGKWITAYIQLPEGYDPADINASTILLNGTIASVLDPKYGFVTNSSEYLVDYNMDGILERMVKFDRATVASWIYQSVGMQHEVSLTITGELTDGTKFEGTTTILVLWQDSRPPSKR